ncbi:LysR family transcriptional regulator [Vitiosangium sp. GDMCC 1.1324]|uniref:LysR family transcriptional regulator n=1 Tax=Vitiosangium sp. (strain GDMCC 1.1324) TaxID=2138576 RepID=UPI000D3BD4EC|nr:LysR family transcriptional regulator [Vitiosangium sp. GDMCC 1.1324]PTL83793.1 LysR family transcriptional regulator [Vitiosangium sp. GDMCC 1.1324]
MDTIRAMQTFVRAVELGSLSAVAREQHTTQPTVSKVVAALEKSLGVRLLDRTTTSLAPTEQGKRFYERATRVLEEFGEAVSDARGLSETPAGRLRVSAPASFGVLRLNALMLDFLSLYPDIELELSFDDRFVDLVEEGVDVALRLGATLPPNVVARRIAASPRYLVASPAYLRDRPRIRTPRDLARHEILRFTWLSTGETIELDGPGGKVTLTAPCHYRVNNSLAMRESFLRGAGFGMTPAWLVQDLLDTGELVRVLPRWSGPTQDAFLLYPSRRYQPARTNALLRFLAERIPRLPGFVAPEASS